MHTLARPCPLNRESIPQEFCSQKNKKIKNVSKCVNPSLSLKFDFFILFWIFRLTRLGSCPVKTGPGLINDLPTKKNYLQAWKGNLICSLIQPTLWFIWHVHMRNSLTHRSHCPSTSQEEFLLKILKVRDLFTFYTCFKFTLFTQHNTTLLPRK